MFLQLFELNSDLTVVDRFNVQAETTEGDVINWIKSFGSGKKAINLFQIERALMFGEAGNFYILLARNATAEEITGIAVNSWNQHTFSFKYDSDFSYSRLISNADLGIGLVSSGAFEDITQAGIYYVANAVTGKPDSIGGLYVVASPYNDGITQTGLFIVNNTSGGVYKVVRSSGSQNVTRIDQ